MNLFLRIIYCVASLFSIHNITQKCTPRISSVGLNDDFHPPSKLLQSWQNYETIETAILTGDPLLRVFFSVSESNIRKLTGFEEIFHFSR